MELAEIVMNPVRQRIFQFFLLHETPSIEKAADKLLSACLPPFFPAFRSYLIFTVFFKCA